MSLAERGLEPVAETAVGEDPAVVENRSWSLDLMVLAGTVPNVLARSVRAGLGPRSAIVGETVHSRPEGALV